MLNDLNNIVKNTNTTEVSEKKSWQKGYDAALSGERDRTIPYSKGEYEHQPENYKQFALGYNEGLKNKEVY